METKEIIYQTSFKELPNGEILEMGYNGLNPYFIVFDPNTQNVKVQKSYKFENVKYVPFTRKEGLADSLVDSGAVLLCSEATEHNDSEETLVKEIREFIHKYLEIPETFEKLASYYVLLTYVYRKLPLLPYLRVLGEMGTAKSRFLNVVGDICYRPIKTSGATTSAPIFRTIEKYNGTILYDEGDITKEEQGDLFKILKQGFSQWIPVLRCQKETSDPEAYSTFGPKIIANINRFKDPQLESRLITFKMKGRTRDDIPLLLPIKEFREETLKIRNKLLFWGFTKGNIQIEEKKLIVKGIADRINQIFLPLLAIIDDPTIRADMQTIMINMNEGIATERAETFYADIFKIILELYLKEKVISVGKIADVYNIKNGHKPITAHKCGRILRSSALDIEPKRSHNGTAVELDQAKINELCKKFGIEIEVFRAEFLKNAPEVLC